MRLLVRQPQRRPASAIKPAERPERVLIGGIAFFEESEDEDKGSPPPQPAPPEAVFVPTRDCTAWERLLVSGVTTDGLCQLESREFPVDLHTTPHMLCCASEGDYTYWSTRRT